MYRLDTLHLILIIAACVVLGTVIGGQNPMFFGRYYVWMFILFLVLIAKPVHRWLTTKDVKRKRNESDEI